MVKVLDNQAANHIEVQEVFMDLLKKLKSKLFPFQK